MLNKYFVLSEERVIYWALVGSCVVHASFLTFAYFVIPPVVKAKVKPMEIRYQPKEKQKTEQRQAKIESVSESRKNIHDSEAVKMVQRQLAGAAFLKDTIVRAQHVDVPDKQPPKMTNLVGKRTVSLPVFASQKFTNPKYVGYDERVRDKVRNRAYFYTDDPKFEAGEVYLTFVVTKDGNLKEVQIIDGMTKANDYLRAVGLRSIKESAPFPAFPAGLDYPELTYNVVISFQVNGN
jgi:outer membrane biosynthesis protein TonB